MHSEVLIEENGMKGAIYKGGGLDRRTHIVRWCSQGLTIIGHYNSPKLVLRLHVCVTTKCKCYYPNL